MSVTDTIKSPSFIFYESLENVSEQEIDTSICLYPSVSAIFEQYSNSNKQDSIVFRESIFENHRLTKRSAGEEDRVANQLADWVFPFTLGIFFLLTLIIRFNTIRVKDFMVSLFSVNSLNTVFAGGKSNIGVPVFFLFTSSFSLFIYWILDYYDISFFECRPIVSFLLIFVILIAVVFFKYFLISILGKIFQTKRIVRMYTLNGMNYNFLASMVLSAFLLLLFFSTEGTQQWVFPVLCVCLAFLFFLRIVMGFKILAVETKFSKPYLFLYLCIIEILPILALVKYVIW